MMKTLFLHPPSFDGFDGGAGSRYQARREIRSFWYPTWLAQPAALVPGSKLIDAPPARHELEAVTRQAGDFELCVMHTSTPSFASDVQVAQAMKDANPALKIGFVGAKVAVQPEESLQKGAPIDFVARNEFDFTIKEVAEGRDFAAIDGLSWRGAGGGIVHNKDRAVLEDMDQLPFVTEVYKRDLQDRGLFHRLPAAPLRLAVHGARLQVALHLLPLAADRRRPSLPGALAASTSPRRSSWCRSISRRTGKSSSTTTPSPTISRAPRRSRTSWENSASRGRATPRRTCRARR